MDYPSTIYPMNICYEDIEVIFCPHCGTMNRIDSNWYIGVRGLRFCIVCGKEI